MAIYLGNLMIGVNGIAQELGSSVVTLDTLNATSNTTYNAPFGTAYSQVNVNVPPTFKYGVMRSDATLVKSIKQDYLLVTDNKITNEDYSSIPNPYSTTSITLRSGADTILDTIQININDYNYYILVRTLTNPIYNISTKAKGRVEYHFSEYCYELIQTEANLFKALIDNTMSAGTIAALTAAGSTARLVYWSSASALALYSTTAYGTCLTMNAPAYASGVLTIKDTNVLMRGHSTYFTSAYYNATTDIRIQNIFDIYRISKDTSLKGWNNTSIIYNIANCILNNGNLT